MITRQKLEELKPFFKLIKKVSPKTKIEQDSDTKNIIFYFPTSELMVMMNLMGTIGGFFNLSKVSNEKYDLRLIDFDLNWKDIEQIY